MAEHDLKTPPEPFAAVRARVKRCEIRRDDRGFEVGDTLVLREYFPVSAAPQCCGTWIYRDPSQNLDDYECSSCGKPWSSYTGAAERVVVTHIVRGAWGIPADVVVMSIVPEDLRGR